MCFAVLCDVGYRAHQHAFDHCLCVSQFDSTQFWLQFPWCFIFIFSSVYRLSFGIHFIFLCLYVFVDGSDHQFQVILFISLSLGIRVANAFSLAYGIHIHTNCMHTTTEQCIRCWHIMSVGAYCMAWCIWYVCALCVCNFIPFVRCRSLNAVKMTIWIPLLFNFIISYSRVYTNMYALHIKSNGNTKTITKLDLWHTIEGK